MGVAPKIYIDASKPSKNLAKDYFGNFFPLLDCMAHLPPYDRAPKRDGTPFPLKIGAIGTSTLYAKCVSLQEALVGLKGKKRKF